MYMPPAQDNFAKKDFRFMLLTQESRALPWACARKLEKKVLNISEKHDVDWNVKGAL